MHLASSLTVCNTTVHNRPKTIAVQGFLDCFTNNYTPIPESTAELRGLIPDRICPRCQRFAGGRAWGGTSEAIALHHCQCGHRWVQASPEVKAAKTRVHQALLNGGAR
jgi:hypothetical protein